MTKIVAIEEIRIMSGDMTTVLTLFQVKHDCILHRGFDQMPYAAIRAAHKFLKEIYDHEYKDALRIFKMQSTEYWVNYIKAPSIYGDFHEMITIMEKLKALRKALSTTRPEALTKKEVKEYVKSTQQKNDQSKHEAKSHGKRHKLPTGEVQGDSKTTADTEHDRSEVTSSI